jgi:hypothetical protein
MELYPLYLNVVLEAEAVTTSRHLGRLPVDAAEVEQFMHTALCHLRHSQPRIAEHLPALSLHKLLFRFNRHRRIDQIWSATSRRSHYAMDAETNGRCRTDRQHCWPVSDGFTGGALCRCRGRAPFASAWNGRLPRHTASRQVPTSA